MITIVLCVGHLLSFFSNIFQALKCSDGLSKWKKGVNANWCWCLFYTKRIFLLIIIICFDCDTNKSDESILNGLIYLAATVTGLTYLLNGTNVFQQKNLKFIFPNEYKTTTKHQCIHWGQRFCHCKKTVVLWMKWKKLSFSMDRAKKRKTTRIRQMIWRTWAKLFTVFDTNWISSQNQLSAPLSRESS